jgi:hypothetical protein
MTTCFTFTHSSASYVTPTSASPIVPALRAPRMDQSHRPWYSWRYGEILRDEVSVHA